MSPRIGGRRVPRLVSLVLVLLARTVAPANAAWNGRFNIWRDPRTWQDVRTLGRKFEKYAEPDSPAWSGKWVTVIPRAGLAIGAPQPSESEPPAEAPDMYSVAGWTSMFDALAHKLAVRDLLWLGLR